MAVLKELAQKLGIIGKDKEVVEVTETTVKAIDLPKEKVPIDNRILALKAQNLSNEEIAEALRLEGYKTGRNAAISRRYVAYKLKKLKANSVPRKLRSRNHLAAWLKQYGKR